jgi:hypothetical protein
LDKVNFPPPFSPEYVLVNPHEGENLPLFHSGEIIRGTVIDQVDPLHTLIRIKGQEILVENRGVSLTKDGEFIFRVEETHPQVVLKVIPEETLPGQEIESFLPKYLSSDLPLENLAEKLGGLWKISPETMPPEVRNTLTQLFSLLNLFSFLPHPLDPMDFPKIVAQSGLFWEAKLKHFIEGQTKDSVDFLQDGDLKGLLMKLKSQLNSLVGQNEISEPTAMKDLVKGLGQFVDKIELYQLLNLNQADAQGKILLFFPLWVQNNLQFVELNFSFPRQDGEAPEKEGLSILFLLHLPDWGRMRIEVRVKGKGLYCSFMVSDPEVKKVLNQALPELSQRLNQAGYEPLFQVSVESMERMGQSLVPDMEKWTDSLLNIVV